jgi:hypothetical protein
MTDDTIPLFAFPALQGKKITAAFDGGRMSSDGGVMLLSLAVPHPVLWTNGWLMRRA